MSKYEAIDCQSFAGAFTLGVEHAGIDVVAKREGAAGFGVSVFEDNIDHFPNMSVASIQTSDPEEWEPRDVPLVFGNPPCSGFSGFSVRVGGGGSSGRPMVDYRSLTAPVNQCMWDHMRFGAACNAEIIIMESVTAAGKAGLPLMRDLHAYLEQLTGEQFTAYHVHHNHLSIGGASMRKRFFLVLSKVPFGIETYPLEYVPLYGDIAGDIEALPLKRGDQRIRRKPESARWAYEKGLHREDGKVDGHVLLPTSKARRTTALAQALAELGDPWRPGEKAGPASKRYVDLMGGDPKVLLQLEDWNPNHLEAVQRRDWEPHIYQEKRWSPKKPAYVLAGYGLHETVHPTQHRTLTVREGARIIGLPDTWDVRGFIRGKDQQSIGKGIPVHSGQWIAEWAKRALDGEPGAWVGEQTGEREFYVNNQLDYKLLYSEKHQAYGDYRSKELVAEMEARPA